MIEDGRAILGANVVALTVQGSRVVCVPEDVEQSFIGDGRGVVGDLNGFGGSSFTCADHFICGIWHLRSGVSWHHRLHAFETFKNGFGTPETPSGKGRGFQLGHELPSLTMLCRALSYIRYHEIA